MTSPSPIAAVIFDWAGTTVDHGSLAPVVAIRQLFALRGIELSDGQIRHDMGLHKREHLRRILQMESVRSVWQNITGQSATEDDVDHLFDEMLDVQLSVLTDHSNVLPGVTDTVAALRARGIKIGSTTGYARSMMTPLLASAAKQGYSPDAVVCPEEVSGQGRPFPWMIFRALFELGAFPPSRCVKVGDTVSDIEEGRNAGLLTVGVTRTGNLVGLSDRDWRLQTPARQQEMHEAAKQILIDAGAHFILESVSELPALLPQLEQRAERSA